MGVTEAGSVPEADFTWSLGWGDGDCEVSPVLLRGPAVQLGEVWLGASLMFTARPGFMSGRGQAGIPALVHGLHQ